MYTEVTQDRVIVPKYLKIIRPPYKAILRKCNECIEDKVIWNVNEACRCDCPFLPWRLKRKHPGKPLKAIKRYCIRCAGEKRFVMKCDNKFCPLWPYRLGKLPLGY